MDLGLSGKTVIVTGGGSNIGRGIFLAFAKEGANVVNADIDEEQGRRLADQSSAMDCESMFVRADVTDCPSVKAMVEKVVDRFGKVDVLVNNVGRSSGFKPFSDKSRADFEREIQLNYWSVINCTQAVIKHMIDREYGKIINISSVSGQWGYAAYNQVNYGGVKSGVIGLSRALAWELGRYGVNVNVVCPGWIIPDSVDDVGQGSWWSEWGFDTYTRRPDESDVLRKAMRYWPIRRMGRPQDIADVVLFLSSDRASFLTGQTISVSGGMTMW